MDPFIGEIRLVGFNYEPEGWAFCDGRTLQIAQYNALYALLGTMYGGDGRTTFCLPDLRSRIPLGIGTGPGLSPYIQGQMGGAEQVTLQPAQAPLAAHTHSATYTDPNFSATATGTVTPKAKTGMGSYVNTPINNFLGPSGSNNIYSSSANGNMGAADVSINVSLTKTSAGSVAVGTSTPIPASQGHENRMPFIALNYIIALVGIFPPRQ